MTTKATEAIKRLSKGTVSPTSMLTCPVSGSLRDAPGIEARGSAQQPQGTSTEEAVRTQHRGRTASTKEQAPAGRGLSGSLGDSLHKRIRGDKAIQGQSQGLHLSDEIKQGHQWKRESKTQALEAHNAGGAHTRSCTGTMCRWIKDITQAAGAEGNVLCWRQDLETPSM